MPQTGHRNVIKIVEYAKEIGALVVGITGYSGSRLKELADYSMYVLLDEMQISEEIHMMLRVQKNRL